MTVRELIKSLGGPKDVAAAMGLKPQVVSNWYDRGVPAQHQMRLWRLAAGAGLDWRPADSDGISVTPLPPPAQQDRAA